MGDSYPKESDVSRMKDIAIENSYARTAGNLLASARQGDLQRGLSVGWVTDRAALKVLLDTFGCGHLAIGARGELFCPHSPFPAGDSYPKDRDVSTMKDIAIETKLRANCKQLTS